MTQSALDLVSPAQLCGVEKRFGRNWALRGLDLELRRGEVLALLGPNGAGKTTAVRILLGLRRPDAGRARLFGLEPGCLPARQLIGVTAQETSFPGTLTVRELVDFVRSHYRHPHEATALLHEFRLKTFAHRQAGGLSGGERRRLAVALAFSGRPEAVFLDEPTTGLDVESRRQLWDGVQTYADRSGAVLLTTHYLEEAEALASRVLVIAGGRTLKTGSVSEIKAGVGVNQVRIRASTLPELPTARHVVCRNGLYTIYTSDVDAVIRCLVDHDVSLQHLEVASASLEEAFLALTQTGR